MAQVRIREFERVDYPDLGRINDALFPGHPLHLKRVEYEDSCYGRTRYRMKRFVAENERDEVVGFGEFKHLFFSFHPQRYAMGISVAPEWQRRGVGGMLYDRVVDELRSVGAKVSSPLILSSSDAGTRFVKKRGFVERSRSIESRLGLGSFDSRRFSRVVGKLGGEGITLTSFAEERRTDASAGRKLMELEESGAADVPHAIADMPMGLDDYQIVILGNPVMDWEGSFVAKDGDRYVGSSSVMESGIDGMVDQGFTVVRPGYRKRGIAQAVKLKVAIHAKNGGVKFVRTYNDADNAPMLAVNRKMGFEKRAEWIAFEKSL